MSEKPVDDITDDRAWLLACAKYQRDAATNLRTVATDDKAHGEAHYHDSLAARYERIAKGLGERERLTVTPAMVERAARAIANENGWNLTDDDSAGGYYLTLARCALTAALAVPSPQTGDRGAGA